MKQPNNAKNTALAWPYFFTALIHRFHLRANRRVNLRADRPKEGAYPESQFQRHNNASSFNFEWLKLLDRSVFLIDGSELGKIEAVNSDVIVIKNGSVKAVRYYVTHEMLRKKEFFGYDYDYQAGKLELDLTYSEAGLYACARIPNPCRFMTLGTSCFGYFPRQSDRKEHSD